MKLQTAVIGKEGLMVCNKCFQPVGMGDLGNPSQNGLADHCRTPKCSNNPEKVNLQLENNNNERTAMPANA